MGAVVCWGRNYYGQATPPASLDGTSGTARAIATGGNHTLAIRVESEPDADGDGVPDVSDNCPFAANSGQEDAGGIGRGSSPDGIGDACQCGDVSDDGVVTGLDGTSITRASHCRAPSRCGVYSLAAPEKCDVGGTAGCTGRDGWIVKRASRGLPPGIAQGCPAAVGP